ncbi:MAG TPA: TonB-dependent receptor [Bryobacteraceae bacterium]|nr:TonB-dependent receptor [Bryobacteraceae bacterium]
MTRIIFSCVTLFFLSAVLWGQEASIGGRVTDPAGALVVKAEVTATNVDTGSQRKTETNDLGQYFLPSLPAGNYEIRVRKEGFQTLVREKLTLSVAQQATLDFALQIGQTSQTVTVTEGTELLQTSSAAVSTVVDHQFVENLPLNGRSFQSLIELTPGIVVAPATIGDEGQFSVNGQRTDTNYFMVDGVSANIATGSIGSSTLYRDAGGSLPGFSVLGGTNNLVSVDAMQEFRIQTSTYAPEYGHSPGAQVSIVTRTGTNEFHGTAFDYLRNDKLDANDWFANSLGLPKPAEKQNDFGGVLGGPIRKDHTFFFFSYEGLQLRLPQTSLTSVPSLRVRQSAPAAIQPYLNAFPQPNGPEVLDASGSPTGFAPFNSSYSNRGTLNATSLRVDHVVNSKLTLFGRFDYSPSVLVNRGGFNTWSLNTVFDNEVRTTTVTGGADWSITPAVANETRFNYSRNLGKATSTFDNFGGAVVPASNILYPSPLTPAATVQFVVTAGQGLGYDIGKFANTTTRQVNLVDNVSWLKGSHAIKAGVDYRLISPTVDPYSDLNIVDFNDVPSVLAGKPFYVVNGVASPAAFYFHNVGLFGQDTWKVTPRLTLTYGLRWEFNPPPSADKQLLAVTQVSNPATAALAAPGAPLWNTTYNNFAPRVGVAYQINQTHGLETVIRGGFGVFYDLGTQAAGRVANVGIYPYGASNIFFGAAFPLIPATATVPPITLTPPVSVTGFDPNLKLPYTLQWNVAVEQAFGASQKLSVTYVGAAGRSLAQESVYGSPNPTFSTLYAITNGAASDYDALQIQFVRRLSHGLQSLVSYNWSHSIDDASAAFIANTSSVVSQIVAPGFSNRGPSDFDIRHTFSAALTYDIPTPHATPLVNLLLGGWALDNLIQARTAAPVDVSNGTPSFVSSTEKIELRPDVLPGQPLYLLGPQYPGGKALNFAAFQLPAKDPATGFPTHNGDLGRNALRGFGASQWDFSVRRQFQLHERWRLQFKADLFNLLNHPNFGPPQSSLALGPSLFGKSTQMLGRSLGQSFGTGFAPLYQLGGPRSAQLALKLIF